MPNPWIEHIKEFARTHNTSYGCALTMPDCKASYHAKKPQKLSKKEKKEVAGMEAEDKNVAKKDNNVSMTITELPKKKGRPQKYATEEERKKAKTAKTIESNKRRAEEKKKAKEPKGRTPTGEGIRPVVMKGEGIIAGYSAEATNGLSHIYPLTKGQVLAMFHNLA